MYTERAVRRTYDARNERAARTMATFIISLCAILMLTTVSGLICRKAQLPEVIGQILVGILVGPSLLGVMHMSDSLSLFSDLGIIILMFLGGVGCDLQLLKKYSKAAVIIACMGVVFPVAGWSEPAVWLQADSGCVHRRGVLRHVRVDFRGGAEGSRTA